MLASEMMYRITSYRNSNGSEYEWSRVPLPLRKPINPLKAAVAEVRYISVILIAIAETALRLSAMFFAYCAYHTGFLRLEHHDPFGFALLDIKRSAFCIAWAATYAVLNLFCFDLIENGANAWKAAQTGNITYPQLEYRHIDGRPTW